MSREGDYISLRDLSSSRYFHPVFQRNPQRRWNAQKGNGGLASRTHLPASTVTSKATIYNEG